jgi:hypothetical protein
VYQISRYQKSAGFCKMVKMKYESITTFQNGNCLKTYQFFPPKDDNSRFIHGKGRGVGFLRHQEMIALYTFSELQEKPRRIKRSTVSLVGIVKVPFPRFFLFSALKRFSKERTQGFLQICQNGKQRGNNCIVEPKSQETIQLYRKC